MTDDPSKRKLMAAEAARGTVKRHMPDPPPYDQDQEEPVTREDLERELNTMTEAAFSSQTEAVGYQAEVIRLRNENSVLDRRVNVLKADLHAADMRAMRPDSIVSRLWGYVALLVVGAVIAGSAFLWGHDIGRSEAVCHSTAEDAVITDCDYRGGGWYPE